MSCYLTQFTACTICIEKVYQTDQLTISCFAVCHEMIGFPAESIVFFKFALNCCSQSASFSTKLKNSSSPDVRSVHSLWYIWKNNRNVFYLVLLILIWLQMPLKTNLTNKNRANKIWIQITNDIELSIGKWMVNSSFSLNDHKLSLLLPCLYLLLRDIMAMSVLSYGET